MTDKMRRTIAGSIAVALLLGFVALYTVAIWQCWIAAEPSKLRFSSEFVYAATGLAGLVGGIVAMSFNEQLPVTPDAVKSAEERSLVVASETGLKAGKKAAIEAFDATTNDVLHNINAAYAIAYFITGGTAIVTWLSFSKDTPDLIRNLALIVFGLVLAIAKAFIPVPKVAP
ncbi:MULTISPECIES: hypothetical protein [unclassified Polaromonas]|uniref:hypothetical protein n=1 Tax=unclassified Polaromonas TaxID=2638319 RepID=UPI000F08B332|nr:MULTISPECIES: hypothetical protein [unclassified Polaromonas]AYQ27631.1 hypothetical protein DT070_06045 [Polaromonas sp. SP1]QGJ17525.1 hypothetical protein F7R28_03390 [Polaromonas sp. Pch-P]